MKPQHGFTLIELVVVIVILGILAATALPKFVDLGKDARIAALNGLKGAIETGAREGYAWCLLATDTCGVNNSTHSELNPGGSTHNYVIRNGVKYYFHFGYPIAWDEWGSWWDGKGILSFINYSGFTPTAYISASYFVAFNKDGAPQPSNCAVIYEFPGYVYGGANPGIQVRTVTSGC